MTCKLNRSEINYNDQLMQTNISYVHTFRQDTYINREHIHQLSPLELNEQSGESSPRRMQVETSPQDCIELDQCQCATSQNLLPCCFWSTIVEKNRTTLLLHQPSALATPYCKLLLEATIALVCDSHGSLVPQSCLS